MACFATPRARVLVWCAGLLVPVLAAAQSSSAVLAGVVRDSSGRAIPGVEVRMVGLMLETRTNDSGGFRMSGLPLGPATVSVRRMGFGPTTTEVRLRPNRTDSLVFVLTAVATTLPGVLVEDERMKLSHRLLAGFWERRERGFGSFVTREQIEQREARDFVDLVRTIPSVRVGTGSNGRNSIRFNRSIVGKDCPPQYFVDGMRIENGSPDEFVPDDVEAIEIYPGAATLPVQFAPRPMSYTCGAVVIWTRLPGG
jgi:hypothetical protein